MKKREKKTTKNREEEDEEGHEKEDQPPGHEEAVHREDGKAERAALTSVLSLKQLVDGQRRHVHHTRLGHYTHRNIDAEDTWHAERKQFMPSVWPIVLMVEARCTCEGGSKVRLQPSTQISCVAIRKKSKPKYRVSGAKSHSLMYTCEQKEQE